MANYKGEQLLDRIYSDLFSSDSVQHTRKDSDRREESIKRYLKRLENIQNKITTNHRRDLIKKLWFDEYIIKEENIPNTMNADTIISAQSNSLLKWIDYLRDEEVKYPMWAKYWIFRGMIRLGSYDDIKGVYNRRSATTIAPFIAVNPEIIDRCVNNIIKLLDKAELSDEELEELIESESFQKLYTIFEKQSKKDKHDLETSNDGIWIKYNQGNFMDSIRLADSIARVNLDWCTAVKEVAKEQLCGGDLYVGGDFYVYYTEKDGEYIMPRIAIRLDGHDKIGEIRGAAEGQNLEKCMKPILEEKLKEMDFLDEEDRKEAFEKIEKLEELYSIGQKTVNNTLLSEDEIVNLYTDEYGFGECNDPHVKRIRALRNINDDYKQLIDKDKRIRFMRKEAKELANAEEDKEILLEAAKDDYFSVINCASEELKSDKQFILELINSSIAANTDLDKRNVKATLFNTSVLESISDELKTDQELILSIIEKLPTEAKYIDSRLLEDKNFIKKVLDINSQAFKYFIYDIRNDKEIALYALSKDPELYIYVGVDAHFSNEVYHLFSEPEDKRIK